MAFASPSAPSFCCNRSDSTLAVRFHSHRTAIASRSWSLSSRCIIMSRLKPSGADGSVSPENGDLHQYELQHALSAQQQLRWRRGSPVFVTLPIDAVAAPSGQLRRRKAMAQSFRALAAAGVEGVVMEVWWGLVERALPGVYNWQGYMEIVALAKRCGLKVRAAMAFHQCGTGPGDPYWIPLPQWVLEEVDKDPDLAFSDRLGRRSMEYISIGCDTLPILCGRSTIQAYSDFMRNFRDTFKSFLGSVITGIQVGMGPAGELRYPSCPSQKLTWPRRYRELGEFQCYDKYMLASLSACAQEIEMSEWGNGGPIGASNLMQNPEQTEFFRSAGSWNTPYGEFFLKWYSRMLLLHGERICQETETIFRGTEVSLSAKVGGIHWHYSTKSHPSELTAGYYNTSTRDGFISIARIFGRYGFTLCCSCFEMQDSEEKQINPASSPEGFIQQLLLASSICEVPLEGENSVVNLDDGSFQQVLKMLKLYPHGENKPSFSFNFVRMDKNMFEYQNWVRFTRFVKQMSEAGIFRAKLAFAGDMKLSLASQLGRIGLVFAH